MLLLQFHPLCMYIYIYSNFQLFFQHYWVRFNQMIVGVALSSPTLGLAWQLPFWLKTARKGASIWLYVNQLADSKFISPVQQN